VIQVAGLHRGATPQVDDPVQGVGINGRSKGTVAKLWKDIDERVQEFLNRPLAGGWPYL